MGGFQTKKEYLSEARELVGVWLGLFRNKDADIDFEELMSEISPICNNEFNSNEYFLLKD